MLPELGLSLQDQQVLIQNVSVVFHSAATVKFDELLKLSVEMNIVGTKRLLKLCQNMVHIKVSLVYNFSASIVSRSTLNLLPIILIPQQGQISQGSSQGIRAISI